MYRKKGWLERSRDIRIFKLAPRASIFHPFNIFYNCDNEQLSDHGVTFLYLQQSLALQDLQTNVSRVNYYGHQLAFRILKIHSAYKFQNHPSMITCTTISNFSMLHTHSTLCEWPCTLSHSRWGQPAVSLSSNRIQWTSMNLNEASFFDLTATKNTDLSSHGRIRHVSQSLGSYIPDWWWTSISQWSRKVLCMENE